MKKIILTAVVLLSQVLNAQVGINTTLPNAQLEIKSSNQVAPSNIDGILIPKVDAFPATNPTVAQQGMMVYLTTTSGANPPGFYYWNNPTVTWLPLKGADGGTLDQAYDFGGAGMGRTITADAGAVLINGNDGLVSTGTSGSGALAPTGAGVKMFWNPRKAAFRSGIAGAATWDDVNIGAGSVAFGNNTTAVGDNAVAIGNSTTASGVSALASGTSNTASGSRSVAFGNLTTASGITSLTSGFQTTASGVRSVAFGDTTNAGGDNATTFGQQTSAGGQSAIAFGQSTSASGLNAAAFGQSTSASADNAKAWGTNTSATNSAATAFGSSNTASGSRATAFGSGNFASGTSATAFGSLNTAPSYVETVIGNAATTYIPSVGGAANFAAANLTDRLFVIGNGYDSNSNFNLDPGERSDAMIVLKSGLARLPSTTNAMITAADGKAIVTKEYLTANVSGTLDQAYDFGGAGVGRTITADTGAVLIDGNDGLQVTGTFGSGAAISLAGAGTRMFFNPRKSAFRAGGVAGTQWDNANIGNRSTARRSGREA